jgi:hypothetical protein
MPDQPPDATALFVLVILIVVFLLVCYFGWTYTEITDTKQLEEKRKTEAEERERFEKAERERQLHYGRRVVKYLGSQGFSDYVQIDVNEDCGGEFLITISVTPGNPAMRYATVQVIYDFVGKHGKDLAGRVHYKTSDVDFYFPVVDNIGRSGLSTAVVCPILCAVEEVKVKWAGK